MEEASISGRRAGMMTMPRRTFPSSSSAFTPFINRHPWPLRFTLYFTHLHSTLCILRIFTSSLTHRNALFAPIPLPHPPSTTHPTSNPSSTNQPYQGRIKEGRSIRLNNQHTKRNNHGFRFGFRDGSIFELACHFISHTIPPCLWKNRTEPSSAFAFGSLSRKWDTVLIFLLGLILPMRSFYFCLWFWRWFCRLMEWMGEVLALEKFPSFAIVWRSLVDSDLLLFTYIMRSNLLLALRVSVSYLAQRT